VNKRSRSRSRPEGGSPPAQSASPVKALARRLQLTIVAVVASGAFVYFFRTVLFQPRFFFFRDTGFFYHGLFKYVHQQWAAGRIPLWNPYSNGGIPLLAQGTPCALYPGTLVFWLPLQYEINLNLYILEHFLLALVSTYVLARRLRTDPVAAGLAAISYVFGGAVLFQYCNLPFLCSAAWMPLAFYATLRMLGQKSLGWSLVLAIAAAMMVLSGDPQGAYHALILAALLALIRWIIRERREYAHTKGKALRGEAFREIARWAAERWRRRTLALLVVAGAAGLLLTAAQILPTAELSKLSTRAASQAPNGLYQVPAYLLRSIPPPLRADTNRQPHWYDNMVGNPVPGEQNHIFRYMYSLSPARLLEFVFPNFSGRTPVNASGRAQPNWRWLVMIRGEELDLWFPSCYLGLAPLALAIAAFSPLCRRPQTAWLSWIALIATLGSLGCYGPVWLYRLLVLGRLQHSPEAVGGEVGGVYWLMSLFLPMYESFRYPSKLMSLAALAISLLAAIGLRRLQRDPRWLTRSRYLLLGTAVASFAALCNVLLFPEFVLGRLSSPDWVFKAGVLEPDRIVVELRYTFFHSFLLSTALLLILRMRQTPTGDIPWRKLLTTWTPAILLAITALDLTAANRWMIIAAPLNFRSRQPALVRAVAAAEAATPAQQRRLRPFPRVFLTPGTKGDDYDLATSYTSATFGLGLITQFSDTLSLEQFEPLTNTAALRSLSGALQNGGCVRPRCGLDAWGVDYCLFSRNINVQNPDTSPLGLFHAWLEPRSAQEPQVLPAGPPLPLVVAASREPGLAGNVMVVNSSASDRTWIVRKVQAVEPIDLKDRARWGKLVSSMNYMLGPDWLDLRSAAIVEDAALVARQGEGVVEIAKADPAQPDKLRFVKFTDGEVQIEAELATPGLLVLAETHYPGWQLHVQTDGGPPVQQPVLRVNTAMRGAMLPAGKHVLTFRYVPASFWRGAAISGVAWLGVGLYGLVSFVRRRRRITNPT